ncbi:MAG: patatin-like phospholipase family protein [Acidimicrobiales bacterium]
MKLLRGNGGAENGGGGRPTVGLVLGAGGVVGQAYQAGVLAGLQREIGWDPRDADLIVGTSAGSITGAALRVGVPATDLAALTIGYPLSRRGGVLLERILPESDPLPAPSMASVFRPWRPPSPALLQRVALRPWAFRPEVAAATMMPRGQVDITDRAQGLHDLVGHRWPHRLWICVARRSDGARVVLGRGGSPRATLASAVLASCAIPGYFTPVTIAGTEYFDGGVHSVTNADVTRSEGLDVVVVISSMSTSEGRAGGADGLLRWSVHRRMEREVARLELAGTTVIRLEPGIAARRAMGLRAMAEDRSPRVVKVAYKETMERVASDPVFARLAVAASSANAV